MVHEGAPALPPLGRSTMRSDLVAVAPEPAIHQPCVDGGRIPGTSGRGPMERASTDDMMSVPFLASVPSGSTTRRTTVKTLDDVLPPATSLRASTAATVAFAWMATFAFGMLMVETLLLYPNIFADVPRSLADSMEFMKVTAPGNVLPPLGAATIVTAIVAIALSLGRRDVWPWMLAALLTLLLGQYLFSAVWAWPRNTIMFTEGAAVHDAAYLQQVAAEFQAGHWVRVAAGAVASVLAFTGMLRMHRAAAIERRRAEAADTRP